jgi:hypothetical protein
MGLIESWKDGLVKKGRRELRQVPEKYCWSSGLYCSRNGYLARRFYNIADRTWTWGEPIELALEYKSGEMGLHLAGRGFVPLGTIICRAAESNGAVLRVGKRRQKTAQHLRWDGGEEDDAEDQTPLDGETWSALQYRCGIVPCGDGYAISNKGRLRNPEGLVTKGILYAGSRWASVKGGLLVNLLIAAGLQDEPEASPPCIKMAYDCLMSGHDPEFMLAVTNAKLSSLWSYYCRAVPFAIPSDLAMVWTELVPHDLVRVLHDLRREVNPVLGGALNELMPIVLQRIGDDSEFHDSELQFEQLRFARTCILATTDVESEEE